MGQQSAVSTWPSTWGYPLSSPDSGTSPLPSSVLIVEDNIIILLDTEDVLKELGVPLVMTATNPTEAFALIERTPPAFALLDVDLGFDTSFGIATRLTELGIPFAFVTGYGDNHPVPAELAARPRVLKPHSPETLLAVLTA